MLKQFKSIHFVGIGGIGMSGLARILLAQGKRISGSDIKLNPLMEKLQQEGATIYMGHSAHQIPPEAEYVVVSTAISLDNPEYQEAQARHIPLIHRADLLNYLLQSHRSIAITGTHGKTTTTSMVAVILKESGMDPTITVGGEVPQLGTNALVGQGDYMVAEVDESDQSLRKLISEIAVVTNLEVDHLDHYRDLDEIIEAVSQFVCNRPSYGKTLVNADDRGIQLMLQRLPGTLSCITFGIESEKVDYRAESIQLETTHSTFNIRHQDQVCGTFQVNVPGIHNVYNALSAAACTHSIGIPMPTIADCLAKYKGVKRRFQLVGQVSDTTVIDDYGHHPSEIRASLKTASMQKRPLTVIFQPHRYSRTLGLLQEFATAFNQADRIILTDIYAASEKQEAFPVHIEELVQLIQQNNPGKEVQYIADFNQIIHYLLQNRLSGEIIMTLGAGNITELSYCLVDELSRAKKNSSERKILYAPLPRNNKERKVV